MKTKNLCRECRDGEITANADYKVKGVRTLDTGRKVPYKGSVCATHLESIQSEDTELTEIVPISKEELNK